MIKHLLEGNKLILKNKNENNFDNAYNYNLKHNHIVKTL